MGDDSEWMKLPPDEKVQHKVWKARVAGYEEVTKIFNGITDEKHGEFNKYAGLLKKFVIDNNAVAQEKGMDAVVAFVANSSPTISGRVCSDIISGIIAKCLNSSKQKTKDKGIEIIMLYVESEKQDIVQECLLQGVENKQPKIVVGCLQSMTMALRDFGNKIMPIKPLMKVIPKLLEDRDKNVREETKNLLIEVYRWIGPMLKPMMSNFKPVQVSELEAEFEKLPSGKPQQQRFLRSQQDLKAKMEEQAANPEAEGEEDEEAEENIDPYEMMPSVDILPLIPKDFYEKIEAKKWQERREALEAVQKLCENTKIENGDFGPLVRSLLKVVAKDTNVMLVALAGNCLAGLAKALRKKFAPYAVTCLQTYLEKFKEKKVTVVTALREACDTAYFSTTLEPITEDLQAALENKNPSIKAEAAYFLARCFAKASMSTLPKKQLKTFCSGLLKTVNDTAPEVRERSFEALGTAMKVVTEKHIMPFLVDVDNIKMQKIKECSEKAVLLNAMGEPRTGGSAASAPKPAPSARPATAPPKQEQKPAKAASKPSSRPSTAKPAGSKSVSGKKKAGGKEKKSSAEGFSENPLSDEAVDEKASNLFGAELLTQLASNNWKERLAAVEKMTDVIKGMSKTEIPCQAVVRTLSKKPGLKDTNFQVLKYRVDLVGYLAQNANFSVVSAEYCLPDLVEKVGDVKNGAQVQNSFSCIAEAVTLEYTSKEVLKFAFDQKNPKNQAEALNWVATALREFGMKLNVKNVLANIKKGLAATNPAVRTGAINVIQTLHMYMGPQVRMFFEDEKPALLQQIDAEIAKVKDEKPPAPTRRLKGEDEEPDVEEEEGGEEEAEENIQDLVPRNDVGDKFTPEIISKMSDKNWKIRKEGIDQVAAILAEAKFIKGNLGPLPEALKARQNDVNKVLVMAVLNICTTLGKNLGPHCKNHCRIIMPGLITCLGDTKPHLRAAALEALNTWMEQPGVNLLPLVEAETFQDTLKIENPVLRQELLGWLSEKLPNHKQLPVEFKQCVPLLLNCLEDRNPDVRKKATDALVPFMIHVGYDSVFKATSKLKPASKDQIMAIIEKAKANLPAKPQKTKAKTTKAGSTAGTERAEPVKESKRFDPEPAMEAPESKAAESKGPKTVRGKGKAPPPASKKKKVEEESGPPMTLTVPKEQRFKDEKGLKVLKWNFLEVRDEFVEQLRTQMEKNFSKSMLEQMFHSDFKFHIKAIEVLISCLDSAHDETVGNLDLLLKWFTLRFYDTNPSMLNKALQYLQSLFSMLSDDDYHLHEYEATSFIPYLVLKVGDAKDNVRKDVRKIFKLLYKVYPASKVFQNLIDGLKSKNAKQRMECLEELGNLIEANGISICQPTPGQALKLIAGQIGDRDNGVRNAALNSTVVAYTILGEQLYKYIGNLNDKEQSLLDERIKRSAKNKAAQPAVKVEEQRPKTAPSAQAQPQRSVSQASISRPGTAMPKSASSNSVKKEFAMEIEHEGIAQPEAPKLYQFDLEEYYQPIKPPTINRPKVTPADAATSISMVISQITNSDITTSVQALAQIDELLRDEDHSELMCNHVDQLVLSVSMQLKMAFSTHMDGDVTVRNEVVRLYQCLMATLLCILQNPNMAPKISKDILKDLINNFVTLLLDKRLNELEEGPQVIRAVNVMVVKIVEKTDRTSVISALIKLLQDCVASGTCSSDFLQSVMKCLWKLIRMLPDIVGEINLDKILLDCHLFLVAFPNNTWKSRPNDLPLRTIKTLLNSLGKLKGAKIFNHTSLIESPNSSEVVQYFRKSLGDVGSQNGTAPNEESRLKRGTPKKKNSANYDIDKLTEIFKKIGCTENTKEGLYDLYDFKKKYPDADLTPFLKASTQYFQNYIERALENIEKEREGKISEAITVPRLKAEPQTSSTKEESTADMLERLRILRARNGLENIGSSSIPSLQNKPGSKPASSPPRKSQDDKPLVTQESEVLAAPVSEKPLSQSSSSTDVSELKARLERIKRLAKN